MPRTPAKKRLTKLPVVDTPEIQMESMLKMFWEHLCKSGGFPEPSVPRHPDIVYRNRGWNGWRDWFGDEFAAAVLTEWVRMAKPRQREAFFAGLPDHPTFDSQEWADWVLRNMDLCRSKIMGIDPAFVTGHNSMKEA